MIEKPIDTPLHPRRSHADRRRDVIDQLTLHPEYSDRRLCLICAVSRELVMRIRANMIRLSRIESRHALARVGADGKTYKRLPRPRTREARP